MSYQSQAQLEVDQSFRGRVRSATIQQADRYKDDGRPDIAACANAVLRDEGGEQAAFLRLAVAGPGIADEVDQGDGTIDQSLVSDAELLALTQANFPTVAALYYDPTGAPRDVG